MARPIVGIFTNRESAEQAITDLKQAGFDTNRIGLLMKNRAETKEAASGAGVHTAGGAVTGGLIGGAVGAILAATGTFVIPGIGPFISAGILATAIVGGAVGAIAGALVGMGIPREEAEYYETRVREGHVLVTIDTQGREIEAREILLRNGAEDTWRESPWATSNQPVAQDVTTRDALANDTSSRDQMSRETLANDTPSRDQTPDERTLAHDTTTYDPTDSTRPLP